MRGESTCLAALVWHLLLLNTTATPPPGATNDTRPSILFIHTDSMDGRMLSPSSAAKLLHLQRLAARGVNFQWSYTTAPECVPSRSSVSFGRRNDQTMATNCGKGLDCDYPTLANRLNDGGYEVTVKGRRDYNWYGNSFSPRNIRNWMMQQSNEQLKSAADSQQQLTAVTGCPLFHS